MYRNTGSNVLSHRCNTKLLNYRTLIDILHMMWLQLLGKEIFRVIIKHSVGPNVADMLAVIQKEPWLIKRVKECIVLENVILVVSNDTLDYKYVIEMLQFSTGLLWKRFLGRSLSQLADTNNS